MNTLTRFVERKIAPPLIKFAGLRYIQVIQRMGLGIMSLLIIGSLFTLVASFPAPGWIAFLGDFRAKLLYASGIGTACISIYTVVTISFATVEWYNVHRKEHLDVLSPMVLALAGFLMLNPSQVVNVLVEGQKEAVPFTGIPVTYLGATGIFSAILIAIVTVELYRLTVHLKLTIKLPDNVPPMVANAFVALIPSTFVIFFWWIFGGVLCLNLPEIITKIFQPLVSVSDTPVAFFATTLLNRVLWAVGIHGGNIINGVAGSVWTQMVTANQEAFQNGHTLPYIYTSLFSDNYVYTGIFPLALALLVQRTKRYKSLGVLGLVPSVFNIGEPLIFGLPIMLNPLMMIPFVLSPFVMSVLAIFFKMIGWLPTPVLSVPWITPAPIKAFLSTNGNFFAVGFVLLGWLVSFLIYYPFVVSLDRSEQKVEES